MFRTILALGAAGAMALAALPVAAQDINFQLINNSQLTLVRFHASPTYDQYWGHDILGANVLPPGYSTTVIIADGERACLYDMLFVMEDGQEITGQTDICRSARYVLQ